MLFKRNWVSWWELGKFHPHASNRWMESRRIISSSSSSIVVVVRVCDWKSSYRNSFDFSMRGFSYEIPNNEQGTTILMEYAWESIMDPHQFLHELPFLVCGCLSREHSDNNRKRLFSGIERTKIDGKSGIALKDNCTRVGTEGWICSRQSYHE